MGSNQGVGSNQAVCSSLQQEWRISAAEAEGTKKLHPYHQVAPRLQLKTVLAHRCPAFHCFPHVLHWLLILWVRPPPPSQHVSHFQIVDRLGSSGLLGESGDWRDTVPLYAALNFTM